jgi:t-SNARE complex subunit (syntaxin)
MSATSAQAQPAQQQIDGLQQQNRQLQQQNQELIQRLNGMSDAIQQQQNDINAIKTQQTQTACPSAAALAGSSGRPTTP